MTKTFEATYVTTLNMRKKVQFQVDVPDDEENAKSYAGRHFIQHSVIYTRDFSHLADGKYAIVEVND